jgi:hypothetical protein
LVLGEGAAHAVVAARRKEHEHTRDCSSAAAIASSSLSHRAGESRQE